MTVLLDCPFCGSKPQLYHNSGSYGYTPGSYIVKCSNRECGVATAGFDDEIYDRFKGMVNNTEPAKANAIAHWNRRPQLKDTTQ